MKKIGLQLYTVRSLADDKSLFETIKRLGYEEVELFGGIDIMESLADKAVDANMPISGTISNYAVYRDTETIIKFCRKYNIHNLGISAQRFETLTEIQTFISEAEKMAKEFSKSGIKVSYHNHSHEFIRLDNGETMFEMLADETETIGFIPDTYWIQHGGADIRYWLDRLHGRGETIHLKDMKRTMDGQYYASVGEGNLWWDGILDAADRSGAKHYVVEQDECDRDVTDCIGSSADYLKKFQEKGL